MNIEEITKDLKVVTTTGLLNFEAGTVGRMKFQDNAVPLGASGKTVMVTFSNGGGLYYSPGDLKVA